MRERRPGQLTVYARGLPAEARAEVALALAGGQALPRERLQASSSAQSCADPMRSMSRDPPREEYTICT
jgi:hypothetical protein